MRLNDAGGGPPVILPRQFLVARVNREGGLAGMIAASLPLGGGRPARHLLCL
jgi:hypothetical protein